MTSTLTTYLPSLSEIRGAVTEEVTALGGKVSDALTDGERLFLRALLDNHADIRLGDSMQAGIAVRVVGPEIVVYPYTFRQICANGAIAANALPERKIERTRSIHVVGPSYDETLIVAELRARVRECAEPEAFRVVTRDMAEATNSDGAIALQLVQHLARLPNAMASLMLPHVFKEFQRSRDRSAFGVVNAVTATARTTRDPALKWNLEKIGGSLPALLVRMPRVKRDAVIAEEALI